MLLEQSGDAAKLLLSPLVLPMPRDEPGLGRRRESSTNQIPIETMGSSPRFALVSVLDAVINLIQRPLVAAVVLNISKTEPFWSGFSRNGFEEHRMLTNLLNEKVGRSGGFLRDFDSILKPNSPNHIGEVFRTV